MARFPVVAACKQSRPDQVDECLRLLQRLHPRLPRVLLSGDPSRVPADIDAHVLDKDDLSRLPALVASLAAAAG